MTVVDYAHCTLIFDAADDAVSRDGATVLRVSMVDGEPQVPRAVGNVEGSCAIDTGSRLNITVLAHFAKQHAALLPPSLSAIGADGYSLGAMAYGRHRRLSNVSFGTPGDRVLAADAQTFEPQSLPALRTLLERPAGTCVALLIARTGASARTVDLQPGDYL